jgi:hypothetical protein
VITRAAGASPSTVPAETEEIPIRISKVSSARTLRAACPWLLGFSNP